MNNEKSAFESVSQMVNNSVIFKLVTIVFLTLFLLIPSTLIQEIIHEREQLNQDVFNEVRDKWAVEQQITGPILTIPVVYEIEQDDLLKTTTKYWNLLPEQLNIEGDVAPEILSRGIYDVIVYKSGLHFEGAFQLNAIPDPVNLQSIQYDQAFLTIGITDLRGIKNQVRVNWDNEPLDVESGSRIPEIIQSGITVKGPDLRNHPNGELKFDFSLQLKGSKSLSFVPVGATTNVLVRSSWPHPSFTGNFLPDEREVDDSGFTALWSILQLNRNYPQQWIGNENAHSLEASSFGMDLILPLNDYQKSYRAARYALLTIALTFLIFFLVEILNKRKIHPFQYALVGISLCLFYTLLISISEHTGFNRAYWISTLFIVGLISLYTLSVFKKMKLTVVLGVLLIGIYGFIYITLQLSDYALLMGSVGLTLIIGMTMYFTRNINWYKLKIDSE